MSFFRRKACFCLESTADTAGPSIPRFDLPGDAAFAGYNERYVVPEVRGDGMHPGTEHDAQEFRGDEVLPKTEDSASEDLDALDIDPDVVEGDHPKPGSTISLGSKIQKRLDLFEGLGKPRMPEGGMEEETRERAPGNWLAGSGRNAPRAPRAPMESRKTMGPGVVWKVNTERHREENLNVESGGGSRIGGRVGVLSNGEEHASGSRVIEESTVLPKTYNPETTEETVDPELSESEEEKISGVIVQPEPPAVSEIEEEKRTDYRVDTDSLVSSEKEGQERSGEAAEPECFVPETPMPQVEGRNPLRERAVLMQGRLWVNHTVIRYHMATSTSIPGAQVLSSQDVVRHAFQAWKNAGIGLEFAETENMAEAELRISFESGGSWSYVGTDNIRSEVVRYPAPTMNFGFMIGKNGRSFSVVLHGIGLALGMPQEHQNPQSGLVWDVDAVHEHYSRQPSHWSRATVERNILRQSTREGKAGSDYDETSVMHYSLPAGLVHAPASVRLHGVQRSDCLSRFDKERAGAMYPPKAGGREAGGREAGGREARVVLRPYRSSVLEFSSGEQRDYEMQVSDSRVYRIESYGAVDCTVVLFEENDSGEPRYVAGDNDSGQARNASMSLRLTTGRRYVLRVRMVYGTAGISSVMFF